MRLSSRLAAASLVAASVMSATAVARHSHRDASCPRHLHHRTVEQVVEAHLAAFRSANAALIACDYAKDAVFVLPGTAARGPSDIEATFAGFFRSAGAINQVAVTSLTFEGAVVLMTYTVDSQRVLVSAGVDTFIVRHGMIVAHTAYLGGLTQR